METPHYKHLHRYEHINESRYLTMSCRLRLALFGNPAIRDLFALALAASRARHAFRLIAWVIMPEHVHLLIVSRPKGPRQADVPKILWGLKKPFADRVIARWVQLGAPVLTRITLADGSRQFWQPGGGFDRNIRDDEEFAKTITYIHENPVKRGLVEKPTDWAWSSARWYAGDREGQVPIDL